MKIIVEEHVALDLERAVAATRNEFSGYGFCRKRGNDLVMYDAEILAGGTYGYTEIPVEETMRISKRPDAENMKIWLHRHPVGNGVPGPHNWSGTDNRTILEEPLGGIPELIGWSASIVRTPKGWVGRIDNHHTGFTVHVPVESELLSLIGTAVTVAFEEGVRSVWWDDLDEELDTLFQMDADEGWWEDEDGG